MFSICQFPKKSLLAGIILGAVIIPIQEKRHLIVFFEIKGVYVTIPDMMIR